MSHLKLRKEKNCLNCGTEITDRFCSHCGQENLEPRETLGHLFRHFMEDITHFDGKFFSTLKLLMLQPGFLSEEYMKGKRASYLNPIRMYLFMSFVLFLIEFSLPSSQASNNQKESSGFHIKQGNAATIKYEEVPIDTVAKGIYRTKNSIEFNDDAWINMVANNYSSVGEYDSTQNALPAAQKDGWFARFVARRFIAFISYANEHPKTWEEDYKEIFVHSIPKMLFTSIPAFALLLWLLYFRKRKDFYFVAHGIFTVHLYCAIFLMLIVLFPLTYFNLGGFNTTFMLFVILATIYRYLAMKRFYKQGHFKTIFKFMILSFAYTLIFLVLVLVFAFNSLIVLGGNGIH